MQVKTYRGADTKGVLEQIKLEMGPEAVILGTRSLRDGGRSVCEVTAALERWEEPSAGGSADHDGSVPGWGNWRQEWGLIRENLLALMRPQMDMGCLPPRHRLALDYLDKEGVSGEVTLRLFQELKANPDGSLLGPLGRIVPAKPWSSRAWPQKFHALAGPHGAGKTTSAVRLALELKKEQPDLRICLVNADHVRGGGRLLLKNYSELGGMAYREASTPVEFAAVVRESKSFDRIILDLPGLERGAGLEGFLADLGAETAKDLQVHLVLSPHYSAGQFTAFLNRFYSRAVSSLIWTKLDEAYTYGAVVNTAAETGLPVSALAFGPGLRDTLAPAEAVLLWRLIFKHQLPGEAGSRIQ